MDRKELETVLQGHLDGVHAELGRLFRGIGHALDTHLKRTEAAIADALEAEASRTDARFEAIEARLHELEAGR
jgi:hypothetical protein